MKKRAYIFDLDNTIYPVESVADKMFEPVLQLIRETGKYNDKIDDIRSEMLWKPFQGIADKYDMSEELTSGVKYIFGNMVYSDPMVPFEDYEIARKFDGDLFIVTMGFTTLQHSKVDCLGIRSDFKEVIVVDPEKTDEIKKDAFESIMKKYGYEAADLVIIGDDPDSEVKGGNELGAITVLYDHNGRHSENTATYKISRYGQLPAL